MRVRAKEARLSKAVARGTKRGGGGEHRQSLKTCQKVPAKDSGILAALPVAKRMKLSPERWKHVSDTTQLLPLPPPNQPHAPKTRDFNVLRVPLKLSAVQ